MLIPIRQEKNVIRRVPWVSIVILAINVVAFLGTLTGSDDDTWERELMNRAKAAAEYLGSHPYLECREEFLELLEPRFRGQLRDAREKLSRQGSFFVMPSTRAREQAELDRLVDRFFTWRNSPPGAKLGLVPRSPTPLAFLTSMFMHAGWLHLIGNMLFFYLTAPFLEDVFGRPLFAGFYLVSGIVAGLAHIAAFPDSPIPLVGASGAIAGLMGAFLLRLGRNRIQFLFLPFPIIWKLRFSFFLPAYVVLPFWFLEQLYYARQSEGSGSGVAWWAHIGGFAFGALATLVFRLAKIEERYIHPAIENEISIVRHPSLDRAIEARGAGKIDDAKREIRRVNTQAPGDRDGWEVAFELFLETGDRADAARAAGKLLEIGAKANDRELVERVLGEAIERIPESLPGRVWFAAARWCMKQGDEERADRLLERMVEARRNDPDSALALLRRSALAAKRGDRALAFRLLDEAANHVAATDDIRRQVAQSRATLEAVAG